MKTAAYFVAACLSLGVMPGAFAWDFFTEHLKKQQPLKVSPEVQQTIADSLKRERTIAETRKAIFDAHQQDNAGKPGKARTYVQSSKPVGGIDQTKSIEHHSRHSAVELQHVRERKKLRGARVQ